MPVHDWTRVDSGIFHDFHTAWMGLLRTALNSGLLPENYYALSEQLTGAIGPDIVTLHVAAEGANRDTGPLQGAVAVAEAPPQVQVTMRAVEDAYAHRQRSLTIRHASNHQVIALVEIMSRGNKSSRHGIQAFVDKALSALDQGIHLLIVDLYPPGPRDPNGIHSLLWETLTGEEYAPPTELPLTLVSYSAGAVKTSYVEPVAVGSPLKEMPLFLTPEQYIRVPLQPTYQTAYDGMPRYYRNILEA